MQDTHQTQDRSRLTRRRVLRVTGITLAAGAAAGRAAGQTQSADVRIVLNNVGASAWEINEADADVGPTGQSNPELRLETGTRYGIENRGWSAHPLAFRDADGAALLSQGRNDDGAFADDDAVNWVDEGSELAFTLTEELAGELTDYICTVHAQMVGSVAVGATTDADEGDENGDGDGGGDGDSGDGDDDGSGPGFGPGLALASVAGAGYLLRRRRADED